MKQNKGFTLIEIIIVIVILGVLATLAMPKITGQVESASAAEAMFMMGAIKRAAVGCYDLTSNISKCDTQAELGITVPTSGIKFTYGSAISGSVLWVRAAKISGTTIYSTACSITNPCIYMAVDAGQGVTSLSVDPVDGNPYASIVTRVNTQLPGTIIVPVREF